MRIMAKEKNQSSKSKIKFQFPFMEDVSEVNVVGSFNDWNETTNPLKPNKNGTWSVILGLNPGRYEYKFKTNIGWFNDPNAKSYIGNPFGDDNSLLEVN